MSPKRAGLSGSCIRGEIFINHKLERCMMGPSVCELGARLPLEQLGKTCTVDILSLMSFLAAIALRS